MSTKTYAIAIYLADLNPPYDPRPLEWWGEPGGIYVFTDQDVAVEWMNYYMCDWGASSDLEDDEDLEEVAVEEIELVDGWPEPCAVDLRWTAADMQLNRHGIVYKTAEDMRKLMEESA